MHWLTLAAWRDRTVRLNAVALHADGIQFTAAKHDRCGCFVFALSCICILQRSFEVFAGVCGFLPGYWCGILRVSTAARPAPVSREPWLTDATAQIQRKRLRRTAPTLMVEHFCVLQCHHLMPAVRLLGTRERHTYATAGILRG
jgi:hypothetical protein